MTPSARCRRLVGGRRAAGPVVALLLAGAAAVWWGTSPRPEVPVPPRTADPQQVVQAYLAASNAHDVDTMNALTAVDRVRPLSRFDPTWTLRDLEVSPPVPDPWIGDANTTYAEVVHVDVELHIIKGHDLNFPDDTDTYWGYILGRRSAADPWRIVDQGVL